MAMAAKQSSSDVRGSSNFTEAEEDIAQIAKQISDHAEAIYQTWKSRGLAPTEILNCRPETDNAFNKTLSPKPASSSLSPKPRNLGTAADLLAKAPDLSNNNLNQLVNSFVNEDKARIAAQHAGQLSPTAGSSGSSIKYTLKKFENINNQPPSSSAAASNSPTPSDISIPFINPHFNNSNNNYLSKNHNSKQSQPQQHVPDVLKDTIDKGIRREKPETPQKPEHLLNHVPTWPLKNRIGIQQQQRNEMKNPEKIANANPSSTVTAPITNNISPNQGRNSHSVLNDPTQQKISVMDEVTREEEKLINALKTGIVLNENTPSSLPEVIQSSLTKKSDSPLDQQNGVAVVPNVTTVDGVILNNNSSNNNCSNNTSNLSNATNLASNTVTPPPQKPNHTPIFVHHKEETTSSKSFKSFSHVATTRIPTRQGSASDINAGKNSNDKDFLLKSVPSPVRPFLSRGSVAERVLIFEKCPEKAPARPEIKAANKIQVSVFDFALGS